MPTHLQHDLHLQNVATISDAIAITLIVGPVQEPHWRAIHRFLRQPTEPAILHCPDLVDQQNALPPTLRATLLVKPQNPDDQLDKTINECYLAWLDAVSSPHYEEAHLRAKDSFWNLMNTLADQYIGEGHHRIEDSQALARLAAHLAPSTDET